MKINILFLTLFLFVFNSIQAQTYSAYDEYFQLNSITNIPNDIPIGTIATIDFFNDSLAVLTDPFTQKFLLFNLVDKKLLDLNPELCHPGFQTTPISAVFLNNSKIFLQNSTIQGYWFNLDGTCGGEIDRDYLSTFSNYLTNGYVFPIHVLEFPPYDVKSVFISNRDDKGKLMGKIPISTVKLPNLSNRFNGGGIVATKDSMLYFCTAESSRITEINLRNNETYVSEEIEPSFIKKFPRKDIDFNYGDAGSVVRFFQKANNENSLIISMHQLTERLLIQQANFTINGKRKVAIFIYDRFTKQFLEDKIILDGQFYHAENGKIYLFETESNDDLNKIINPSIITFQYVGPKSIK